MAPPSAIRWSRPTARARGDTPPRAETSAPASLLQREKDRKRAGALVRSPTEDCRCHARRGPGRSRRLSLPLVLPPPRERLGPARFAAGRGKIPSTRGATPKPEQKPPPPRPFSGGRRTGRGDGDDLCVGVETCRGLTGGIPVDDREAVVRLSLPLVLPPLRERRGLARSAGERVARYSPPAGTRPAGNARSDVQMRRPAVLPPHGRGRDARRCLPGRRPTPLSAGPSETGLFLRQMSHRPDHWREPATTTVDAFGIVWYVNRGFIIPDTRRSSYVPPSIFYRTCTSGRRPVDRRRAGSRTGAVFLRSQCRPCDQLGLPRDADARRSDAGR